ncbi:hypothetical protein ABZ215_26560 [Amycolatopsis sp. NPDC006131]|uniref:hypothetical protein n=1 Tax=Amycolatopsis sp. NPDC006131 TaxID=3156731 RepID=UPI0033A8D1BF
MPSALTRPPLAGKEDAAARSGQLDAFLLAWAEGTLREALCRSPQLDGRLYEIFGQGSRVNNTSVDHGSDIDLVLMVRMPFKSNVEALDQRGLGNFRKRYHADPYDWDDFRDDVLAALGESYVARMGRRCVNVHAPDSLFGEMVDILVATEYRLYSAFPEPGVEVYEQGVFFRDHNGQSIVNFPKQHRRNGDQKDLRTGGRFKGAVRAAKRARRLAERERMIAEGGAPSYLLECLLYNVPDEVYQMSSPGEEYRGAVEWLRWCHREDPASFAELQCQNGVNQLFGKGPDQWEACTAATIVEVLREVRDPGPVAAP